MDFTLKSGTNKGHRRIWIEGRRLSDMGLERGDKLYRVMGGDGSLRLSTFPVEGAKVHSIAGTSERLILDMCGRWTTEFMGEHTHFHVAMETDKEFPAMRITPITE